MPAQADMFAPRDIVSIANGISDLLSQEFLNWLPDNLHVWEAFVAETRKVIARGHRHYSSYTIVEFLRHHTAISESAPSYKINNNHRPYLPRLFDAAYPEHAGLFEYRETTKAKGIA